MDIREIARRAGVSRTTVSRYLNDGYVSAEKRKRISDVIEETGYVPSQRAQQLRTGKTHLVGIIMPRINSESVGKMVEGITLELARHGYQAVLATTENDELAEIECLRLFSKRNHVDGIILIATVFTDAHRAAIGALRLPLVILGQNLSGCTCVYQDDFAAVRDLSRLVLRKARRPAFLGIRVDDLAAGKHRRDGFIAACAEAGLTVPDEAQLTVGFMADDGYFGAERLLERVEGLDTIVCATDSIAFGAMMCMIEYGRRVPDEIQVAGVGDSLLSRIGRPSLTTAHLHFKSSGIEAARLLVERMESDSEVEPTTVKMPYEVYGRASMR